MNDFERWMIYISGGMLAAQVAQLIVDIVKLFN